jgi:hypothetical protein
MTRMIRLTTPSPPLSGGNIQDATLRHVHPFLTLPPVAGQIAFQLVPGETELASDPLMLDSHTDTVFAEPAPGMSKKVRRRL